MKRIILIVLAVVVVAGPCLFFFLPERKREFELMDYNFNLSFLKNKSIVEEEVFNQFAEANKDGFPEGFVSWQDVSFFGNVATFRPNDMVNFPYEYYYQIDDVQQPAVRYRLHICHGNPENSNYEFLNDEHPVLTKEEAFLEGQTIMTFAKIHRLDFAVYYKILRGDATYMYGPTGKLQYIYWKIDDRLYVLYGAGDYREDDSNSLMARLLSMDDTVAAGAIEEIVTYFSNR